MQKRERREKLCLLMFTRDNYDEAIGKAIGYSKYLDLIIVVDNSSYPPPPLHNSLKHKIQVFRVFSLGYADPLFYYGVQKALKLGCGYVTLFSVDEELPERSLKDLREVVKDCDAYLLKILITIIENAGRFINSSIRLPIKKYYTLKKDDIDVKLGEYDNIILIIRGLLTTLILNPLKLYSPLKLVDMRSENCC